jgi:hypothetical protein
VSSIEKVGSQLAEFRSQLLIREVVGVEVGEVEGSRCVVIMLIKDSKEVRDKVKTLLCDIPHRIEYPVNLRLSRMNIEMPGVSV